MKLRGINLLELLGNALQVLVGVGAVSGAAIAAAIGNFMLALLLAAVAAGVALRLTRRRLRRPPPTQAGTR